MYNFKKLTPEDDLQAYEKFKLYGLSLNMAKYPAKTAPARVEDLLDESQYSIIKIRTKAREIAFKMAVQCNDPVWNDSYDVLFRTVASNGDTVDVSFKEAYCLLRYVYVKRTTDKDYQAKLTELRKAEMWLSQNQDKITQVKEIKTKVNKLREILGHI